MNPKPSQPCARSAFPWTTRRPAALVGAALLAASPLAVWAQDAPASGKPLWELGVIGIGASQQAYPGARQQTSRAVVLPLFVYRGEYLRADRETLGLRAFKSPNLELDIGVSASLGTSSSDLDARQGMPDLGTLVEFGPRVKWKLGYHPTVGLVRAEMAMRGVFDLSDDLRYRGISVEPRLVMENRTASGWNHSTSIGLVGGNRQLGETLYSVAPELAIPGTRPAYAAESGLIAWRLGFGVSKSLTPDWTLLGFARFDSVAGAANRSSPLVQRRNGATVGMALAYTWARSTTLVKD